MKFINSRPNKLNLKRPMKTNYIHLRALKPGNHSKPRLPNLDSKHRKPSRKPCKPGIDCVQLIYNATLLSKLFGTRSILQVKQVHTKWWV